MLDELRADLSHAQGLLEALGPRPKGDPGDLTDLAKLLEGYAKRAELTARLVRNVPREVVFVAPAAATLADYAGDAAHGIHSRGESLTALAAQARAAARRLHDAQAEYDRNRAQLAGAVEGILHAIGLAR